MTAIVLQINISSGGMPKRAVLQAQVTADGVAGDWSKNRKHHGGPDRAICLFSEELIAQLCSEGVNIGPGDVGENFTTRGLDMNALSIGQHLRVGTCVIEITSIRVPCSQLNIWHPQLLKMIQGRSGWMAKVVQDGVVRPEDEIEILVGKP